MANGVIPKKTCKWCGEEKALNCFYASPNNKDGKQGHCKACDHKRNKKAEKARVAEWKSALAEKTTKPCGHCKKELSFDSFAPASRGKYKLRSWCKECESSYQHQRNVTAEGRKKKREYMRKYVKEHPMYNSGRAALANDKNPELRKKQRRSWNIQKKYGITAEEYDQKLAEQGGRCAICGTDDPYGNGWSFAVDHDHETGKVRDLLCGRCNAGIGFLRDCPDTLLKASEYLSRHKQDAGTPPA